MRIEILLLVSVAACTTPIDDSGLVGHTEDPWVTLEREMREGSWIPVDIDLELLFTVKPEDRWRRALASIGVDPGMVMRRATAVA